MSKYLWSFGKDFKVIIHYEIVKIDMKDNFEMARQSSIFWGILTTLTTTFGGKSNCDEVYSMFVQDENQIDTEQLL